MATVTPSSAHSPPTSPVPPTTHLQLEEGTDLFLPRDSDLYRLEVRPQPMEREGEVPGQGEGPTEPGGVHSYTWQLNNLGDTPLQSSHWPYPVNCFGSLGDTETTTLTHQYPIQSEAYPEVLPVTHLYADQLEGCKPWDQHGECPQDFTLTFPAGTYSTGNHLSGSHYSSQRHNQQDDQDRTQHGLYPKPLYSYSLLIFMALRHSRTGHLPVNEIYRFMAQHFPYFQTAPNGWKNSVRHNLSLNKCFEKVEKRDSTAGAGGEAKGGAGGGASRKGCLWALNPARVEKMMEELRKWRRKEPLRLRRSMAYPEELDCLLNDWLETRRIGPSHFLRGAPCGFRRHPFLPPCVPTGFDSALRHTLQGPVVGRCPSRLRRSLGCFTHLPPYRPEPTLSWHCTPTQVARNAPGVLMEEASGSDVDNLQPSITHLPLQDKLWEEVRDDTLSTAPDPSLPPAQPPHAPAPPRWMGKCTSTVEQEEFPLTSP